MKFELSVIGATLLITNLACAANNQETNILALVQRATSAITAAPGQPASEVIDPLSRRLLKQFDLWLEQPDVYAKKALNECQLFPEGRVYPFVIPAMAYACLAYQNPAMTKHAESQMRKLIDQMIPIVLLDVKPPRGDILKMVTYQKQGTYLSSLNLAFASYERISKDRRYREMHQHVSKLLCDAMIELNGKPLASYPECTWNFDTIMALTSIAIEDETYGLSRVEKLMSRHMQWLKENGTDKLSGLPVAFTNQPPRGCDISMQVCLLADWAPDKAGILYSNYTRAHWVEMGPLSGFRETPKTASTAPYEVDVDSGPVIMGIGLTATGMGVGAAIAMGDEERLAKLARELRVLPELLTLLQLAEGQPGTLFCGNIRFDPGMVTGFLYGDVMMFYSTSWAAYKRKN